MRVPLNVRKALGLFSLFLFLLVLGIAPFHHYAAHKGGGHDSADCAICMAGSQLAGLVTALIILPSCLLPFFRRFVDHIPPFLSCISYHLAPARAPPVFPG